MLPRLKLPPNVVFVLPLLMLLKLIFAPTAGTPLGFQLFAELQDAPINAPPSHVCATSELLSSKRPTAATARILTMVLGLAAVFMDKGSIKRQALALPALAPEFSA